MICWRHRMPLWWWQIDDRCSYFFGRLIWIKSFLPYEEWNGSVDFSIKVWLSLPCNLLMHQKNALHTLYNQNLLFLTVPSRSDDLLCCQLKLLHFLLLLFYLIFFFCIFIFSSVEFWLTGTFFVDVGFIGSSFRKIFICRFVLRLFLWVCYCFYWG